MGAPLPRYVQMADPLILLWNRYEKGSLLTGERFQPMQVTLDRQQGANAWLTIGLREGKNRVKFAARLESVGL